MTNEEWESAADPRKMLWTVKKHCSDRKQRLIAVAFCRRILHLLSPRDEEKKQAVEVAEQCADGLLPLESLKEWREKAALTGYSIGNAPAPWMPEHYALGATGDVVHPDPYEAAKYTGWLAIEALHPDAERDFWEPNTPEHPIQGEIIRDIVGNPFHVRTLDPIHRTSTVINVAQAIYDEGNFDDLPILADALEEAYCDNRDIISHCRSASRHVRGCWVVDLILGKE